MDDGMPGEVEAARDLTRIFDTLEYPDAYRITYLANAITYSAYDAVKRDLGLTRPEYVLLACLAHFEELTAQDVARIARRPRNTVSRAVHRMLAEGFLARTPDPGDGRQARLRITPQGQAMHRRVAERLKRRQEDVLGGLSGEERKTLSTLLLKAARHAATIED